MVQTLHKEGWSIGFEPMNLVAGTYLLTFRVRMGTDISGSLVGYDLFGFGDFSESCTYSECSNSP